MKKWWLWVVIAAWGWLRPGQIVAQGTNGIIEPASGATVSGVVIIQGTATDSSFLRYEIAFNHGGDWIVFAEGDQPVNAGTLAIWDTTVGGANPVFPDGLYQLRLRVVRTDYNYNEYVVSNITISNSGPTPTPSPEPTNETNNPPPSNSTPTPAGSELDLGRPTALPSLTPFPTPPPAATVVSGVAEDFQLPPAGQDEPGLLERMTAIGLTPFRQAFWQGVRLAFYPFLLLAAYLTLRGLLRWFVRQIRLRIK